MFEIVGRRFSPSEFEGYVNGLELDDWRPSMVVLHNTGAPSLAQRPKGFTKQHMRNLQGYYAGKGWRGGPHLFVDQYGIWVFNPLGERGTHSPSWNDEAWGVEMLGDYAAESFSDDPGYRVRANTLEALATLFRKLGVKVTDDNLKLHRQDPLTDHACPGKNVVKASVMIEVQRLLNGAVPVPTGKLVLYKSGHGHEPAAVVVVQLKEGASYAKSTDIVEATGYESGASKSGPVAKVTDHLEGRYTWTWNPSTLRIYAVEKTGAAT